MPAIWVDLADAQTNRTDGGGRVGDAAGGVHFRRGAVTSDVESIRAWRLSCGCGRMGQLGRVVASGVLSALGQSGGSTRAREGGAGAAALMRGGVRHQMIAGSGELRAAWYHGARRAQQDVGHVSQRRRFHLWEDAERRHNKRVDRICNASTFRRRWCRVMYVRCEATQFGGLTHRSFPTLTAHAYRALRTQDYSD